MIQGPNDWRLDLAAPARPILEGLLVNLRRQLAAADVGFRLQADEQLSSGSCQRTNPLSREGAARRAALEMSGVR